MKLTGIPAKDFKQIHFGEDFDNWNTTRKLKVVKSHIVKTSKKRKWKGIFNWKGEIIVVYTHAPNKSISKRNMITQIMKKLGHDKQNSSIRQYFGGQKDNYTIMEETKNDDQKSRTDFKSISI